MAPSKVSPRLLNLTLLFISMMTLTSAASTRSMQKRDDPTNSIGQVDDTGDGSYLPSGTDSSVTAPNADCAECNLPNPLDQPLARLWWTSVDDNDLGQTFLNLSSEECCYDSCQADGVNWSSYSWCEEYKTCWCRPGGIETYNPLRSPVHYPAVNLASTFKSTCAVLSQYSEATAQLDCEDIKINKESGITLLNGDCIRELADGSNGTGTGADNSGGGGDNSSGSGSDNSGSGSGSDSSGGSGGTSISDVPMARLWFTSVDDNAGGIDYLNLSCEEDCYDSCSAGNPNWSSYSWSEQYTTCWCRTFGIDGYVPLHSPATNNPAVNIASTFRSTCADLASNSNSAIANIPCLDVIRSQTQGIIGADGSAIDDLPNGSETINSS